MDELKELMAAAVAAPPDMQIKATQMLLGTRIAEERVVEPWLTRVELGREMNLHPATLWRGKVPGVDLGGRLRFQRSEVEDYLKSPAFKARIQELRQERQERRGQKQAVAPIVDNGAA